MTRVSTALALVALLALPPLASAQTASDQKYPNRPLQILVATPPGGGVDAVTRVVAERLRQKWGQTIIVENRPGAGGILAAETLSRAAPDGYTLFATHSGPLTATAMFKKINYDPLALRTVAVMAVAPVIVLGKAGLAQNSVAEVVAYAKANPGKLTFGSSGAGTVSHLTTELLKYRTGIEMAHVPYRGSSPAVNDLAGGQFDLMSIDLGTGMPLVASKHVKVLGTATTERLPALPNASTIKEQGIADIVTSAWYALVAPPRTPDPIASQLNSAVLEALQSKDAEAQLSALMVRPLVADVAATQKFVNSDAELWTQVIQKANIRLD